MLSKAYYGKDYKQNTSLDYLKALYGQPIAAGPYKFEKYVPGQEVRFVANEHYYAGKPKIKTLFIKSHQVILDSNYSKQVNWTIVDLERTLKI